VLHFRNCNLESLGRESSKSDFNSFVTKNHVLGAQAARLPERRSRENFSRLRRSGRRAACAPSYGDSECWSVQCPKTSSLVLELGVSYYSPIPMDLDPRICSQARRTRDPRFDGRFFIGVRSTRIYCRSICPVRSVKEENVRYFLTAAAAAEAGYRPCLLLIDPWLRNPSNPDGRDGKDPLASISKVDYILLTHGHRDHVGEAVEIAKKTGALLIANPELAGNLVKLTDSPAKQAQDNIMQMGGEIQIADGEVTIAMTEAVHSSSVFNPKAGPNEPERAYGGSPAGFVIMIKNGPTIITPATPRILKTWK
jgi:hypothetical protein